MGKWIGAFILVSLVAAGIFFWLIKAPLLSSYLSKKMGIGISMADISIRSDRTNIQGFSIRNARGFKKRDALFVQSIDVEYQWSNLRSDPVVIDFIEMDQAVLVIEFSNRLGTQNNWTKILGEMPNRNKEKEVLIKKLVITNLTVDIRGMGLTGSSQTKVIDRMEFDDIDSREGFPTQELINRIFGNAGLMQYIENILPVSPQNLLEKILPFGK